MLCYAVLCCVPCHAVPCVPCYAVLYMLCCAVLSCAVLCCMYYTACSRGGASFDKLGRGGGGVQLEGHIVCNYSKKIAPLMNS